MRRILFILCCILFWHLAGKITDFIFMKLGWELPKSRQKFVPYVKSKYPKEGEK